MQFSPGNNFERFRPRNNRKTVMIKQSLPMVGDTELMTRELPLDFLKRDFPDVLLLGKILEVGSFSGEDIRTLVQTSDWRVAWNFSGS